MSLTYTPNGVLFAGSDMSAIYRSADNGNSWLLLNEHDVESPTGTFNVAVDPNNANHLFAVHPRQGVKESSSGGVDGSWTTYRPSATYDPATVGTVLTAAVSAEATPTVLLGTGTGVFRIQPSGATSTWQHLGTLTLPVVKIVFVADPSQPSGQHAFAAARCPVDSCTQADGVYDLASTASTPAFALPHVTDLAGGNTDASHFVLYAAAKSANLYKFASGSTGWTPIPTNNACIVPNLLGLAPGSPNTVYASSNAYGDVAGCGSANVVFRGTVNGTTVTWNPAYNPATISGGWVETTSTFGWGFGGGASAFAMNPANVNAAAFGNFAGVDVTTDGGSTWTQKYTALVNAGPPSTWRTKGLDVTTAWNYYRHAGRQFLAQTDIGLAVSSDGSQWRLINSDTAGNKWGNFYELQFDDTRGVAWAAVSTEHDIPTERSLNDSTISAAPLGAVLLSTDNGSTWATLTQQPGSGPVVSLLYRPASGDLVASVWRDGVYRSAVDASGVATGWTRLGVMPTDFDTTRPPPATPNGHFYQLRQDSAGNLYVVVAASISSGPLTPGALLRLAAGSSTWTRVDNPTNRIVPNDFIIDPSDPNSIYVATNDEQGASPQTGGLWRYTLVNGQPSAATQVLGHQTLAAGTQTALLNTNDLENAAAFSPVFVGSTLYVATTGHGIVHSTDHGASWTQAFPLLRFLRVLRVVPDGSDLWATTFGAGLWNLPPPTSGAPQGSIQVAGSLSNVSVGADGDVWGVNGNGAIFHNLGGANWQQVPGSLVQISVGDASHVWGVNGFGNIYQYVGGTVTWQPIPGSLSNVSVGMDGTVWGVNANGAIFNYLGGGSWEGIPGSLVQVSVGSASHIWGVNGAGAIFHYLGGGGWEAIPGSLSNVSVASDGDVWGVNGAGAIFHYSGGGVWQQLPGTLKQVSVGSSSNNWGVDALGNIFTWPSISSRPQGSTQVPGWLANVSVGADGDVWGVNGTGAIFHYLGGGNWEGIPGSLVQISVGSASHIWGVNSAGAIFHYVGSGGWEAIPGWLSNVSVGADGDVWGVNANGAIFHYLGGGSWGGIPGWLVQVSVGNASHVWGVNDRGAIFHYLGGGSWEQIPGWLMNVSVSSAGDVWGVNNAGAIFHYLGGGAWQQLPGGLKQVSVGASHWGVDSPGNIFTWP